MRNLLLASACVLAGPAFADGSVTYSFDGSFEDVAFGLESAIIEQGLVIDYVSHVGEMLERTRMDVGGSEVLFTEANVFVFCSAALSRKMMEADAMNIAHCPYGIFVAERNGEVMVGYRTYPEGPMQEVQALLDQIAKAAVAD